MTQSDQISISQQVIDIRAAHPTWPALMILDAVMEPYSKGWEQIGTDDLWPPSAFAMLLRDAYEPDLTADEMQLLTRPEGRASERVSALQQRWQAVIATLEDQYDLPAPEDGWANRLARAVQAALNGFMSLGRASSNTSPSAS